MKHIYAFGWFVRMKLTNLHSILTIIYENILRILEAEILEISKTIQPQA